VRDAGHSREAAYDLLVAARRRWALVLSIGEGCLFTDVVGVDRVAGVGPVGCEEYCKASYCVSFAA